MELVNESPYINLNVRRFNEFSLFQSLFVSCAEKEGAVSNKKQYSVV